MATIKNERDVQLQSTTPRLLAVPTNYISISSSTNSFATTSSGIVPVSTSINANLNGILSGAVSWSTTPSTAYSTTSTGISIAGADVPVGTSVVVTASLTFLGNTYSASTTITRAANSSVITLEQTAANINKSSLGVFIPTTVVFTGSVVDGSNPPAAYAGRFVVDITTDGSTYTNLYTSSVNESSYTYTPGSTHKAVKVKLYAAGGISTLLNEKSTSISESGATGSDGNMLYITPSSYVLAKNQNNIFSPTTIVFSGKSKTGTAAAVPYSGRFKIYENGSGSASYSSISDESSTTYTPTTVCTSLKCELYLAGGFITKIDEQGITVSQSGSNAISTVLTNEAHVLPSDSSGNITSYTGSGTQLYVYEGGVEIPYDEAGYTAGNPNTWKVTTSVSNVTAGTKSDAGTYADFSAVSGVASGTDTSTITFTISGRTSIGVAFTSTKVQKFAKSRQGLQGPAGVPDTSNLLVLNAANILTGTVVPRDTGGYKVGTISWNPSTGALAGGTGIAITEWGIIGANSGVPTFTIQAATGAATFLGNITGGSNISITGTGKFTGSTISGSGVHAAVIANDGGVEQYGVIGYAASVFQSSGVLGDAGIKTNARGVEGRATSSSSVGVYCSNSAGPALGVEGRMTITNTTLVTNLNADMVDGYHSNQFCSIVPANTGTCTISGQGFNLMVTGTLASSVRTRGTSNFVYIESISDERLKEDIQDEVYGLKFINSLKPKNYRLKSDPKFIRHGFIAQEVDTLQYIENDSLALPNEEGTWGFDYNGITAPIVKALQELHQEVVLLKERIKILENK